ncbi:multidrug transporter, partial [Streptomyces sp. NPDC057638]
ERHRPTGTGSPRPDWITVQTRPYTDALALTLPSAVAVGERVRAGATVTQGGRAVPVGFPLSADWTGSKGVHLGPAAGAGPWHRAAFDPGTGELTGLRSGEVELSLTVSGVTERVRVRITATGGAPG